jgi:hypothetical protein
VKDRWNYFVKDLKHHTRYFNDGAIEFFDMLFKDIRKVYVESTWGQSFLQSEESKQVIQNYEPGSLTIYRARKVENLESQHRIMSFPDTELSNPPDHLAAEGRMNPKGIRYFYGAEDRETFLAELRLSLSEKAISGEFELTTSVQILDLTLLSQGRYDRSECLFGPNYEEQQIHQRLLRQLHTLIAQPVTNDSEFEYLPTQAMAEYLARRTNPRIDGVIFESVQLKGGRNIVLFPHVLNKRNYSATDYASMTSAVKLKPETLMMHEANKISYSYSEWKVDDDQMDSKYAQFDRELDDLDYQ